MIASTRNRLHLLAAALIVAAGCSSDDPKSPTAPPASPVEPGPAPVVYAVTVSPSKSALEVGTTDSATVTIRATRTDTGAPAPNLTKLSLSTSLGSFGAVGGPQQLEAEFVNGQVQVAFFGSGTVGTATIRAQVTGTGISTSSVGFGTVRIVEGEVPTFFLSSVEPNVGGPLGGERVTIRGGGFDGPIRVLFGGIPAVVRSSTETEIRVDSPALVTSLNDCGTDPTACNQTVSISVTINLNEEGQASDTLANAYSYSNGGGGQILQPIIFSLTPSSGPPEGGTEVVINGDGFQAPVKVEFGLGTQDLPYQEANLLSVSQTRIVVRTPRVPATDVDDLDRLVNVRVTNLDSGRQALATQAFRYGLKVLITSIAPSEGPPSGGQLVTIFGQGFDEPVAVSLAGVGQQVLSVSGSEIVVRTVPVEISGCGEVSGESRVTNIETGDTATGPDYLYRAPRPIVTGASPSSGPQAGNTQVTISGLNFTSPAVVEFIVGGEVFSASVTSVGSNAIVVRTPGVPNSVMKTEDCDAAGTPGKRYIATAAAIRVRNPVTGCFDEFEGAFLYNPSSTACTPTAAP